jgi:tetratricopeptide (TPR) repeat protein
MSRVAGANGSGAKRISTKPNASTRGTRFLLTQHALSYRALRRFDEAQRKLDQALDVTPNDPGILAYKANLAQAEGDLARAAEFLGRVHAPGDVIWLTAQLIRHSSSAAPHLPSHC